MLLCPTQRVEGWYAARRGRITASLAAAIIGQDPYKGPLAAFNEIMATSDKGGPNKHQAWGIEFEKDALACYEVETGNLYSPTGFWTHPQYDWLGASPDGLVGEDGLVEVKCPNPENIGEAPPGHHLVQMAVQMAVLGRVWCDYVAWSQVKHLIVRVTRNLEAEAQLLEQLKGFYEKHIQTGKAPPRRRPK